MKSRNISVFISALCALAVLSAACGDDASPQGVGAAVTETPTALPEPTDEADAGETLDGQPTDEEPEQEPVQSKPDGPAHVAELAWGNFELAERIAAKLEAGDRLNFVLSLESIGEDGFVASEHGWSQAAAEASDAHGIEINARVVGPNRADPSAQAVTVESLLTTGDIDCLVVEAANPGLLDDTIDTAIEAGVPVFSVGGDSPDSKRFAFYGPNNLEAGRDAGSLVGQWAADGGILVRVAGVLTGDAGDQGSYDLMRGFVAGLSEIHSGVVWANGPDDVESLGYDPVAVYNSTEAWVLNNSDADIVFHTDAGAEQLAAVMAEQLLYGDMYAVSFHMSPPVADYIRERLVVAAMAPRRSEQARLAGAACGGFLLEGVYDTGVVVVEPLAVTLDKVDDADWSLPENQ